MSVVLGEVQFCIRFVNKQKNQDHICPCYGNRTYKRTIFKFLTCILWKQVGLAQLTKCTGSHTRA